MTLIITDRKKSVSIRAIRGETWYNNRMPVPVELTEFVPEKIEIGAFRSWELKASESDDTIEICNEAFSGQQQRAALLVAASILLLYGIFVAVIFTWSPPPSGVYPAQEKVVFRVFFTAFGGGIALFIIGLFVVSNYNAAFANASHWKGKFRFQYTPSTGEIYFPRDNVRYSRNDYYELILATTDGYDAITVLEMLKNKPDSYGDKEFFTLSLVSQSYFLVRRKDGTWTRHLMAYDYHSKSTNRALVQIQDVLQCRKARRTMSLPECFTLQCKDADSQPEVPPKESLIMIYLFSLVMAVGGLLIISASIFPAFFGVANPIPSVFGATFGAVFLLVGVGTFLATRFWTRSTDLNAPYTPSGLEFE
jgi:hypothetical protein